MRLISKLHDYYDGAVRTSVSDKTFTFVRESRDIDVDGYLSTSSVKIKDFEYTFKFRVLGFCGRTYPLIEVETRKWVSCGEFYADRCYYDFELFKKDFGSIKSGKRWSRKLRRSMYVLSGDVYEEAKAWLTNGLIPKYWGTDINADAKCWTEIFTKERVAYFVSDYDTIHRGSGKRLRTILYPVLKEYQFYKVYDAYETFQKIEMYLTNELVKPDEINIVIPDELKAHSHGFDKYSFRRDKIK